MTFSKSILCVATLAFAMVFSSCNKESQNNKYSADFELSFTTTEEMDQLTTRQVEVLHDGQLVAAVSVSGEQFYKLISLPNMTAPTSIVVNVYTVFSGPEVPESVKAMNTYLIKCTCGNQTVKRENKDSQTTVTRDKFSSYLKLMNYSVTFQVNEDGTLSVK